MRMIRFAIFGFAMAALASARSAFDTMVAGVVAAIEFMTTALAEQPSLALAGDLEMRRYATGSAIDPALQHRLRHEAGTSRRAAARHI